MLAGLARPAAAAVRAELVEERTTPFARDAPAMRPVLSFSADGSLAWTPPPAQTPPPGCTPNAAAEVVLGAPQVLLWRCSVAPKRLLVGTAPDGRRWTRALEHLSGSHRIDTYFGSARGDAVTLSTLEVLDPATGDAVKAAPVRAVDGPPRTVPVFGITGPVTCPRGDGPCYGYSADGAQAGLLRIARDGRIAVLEKPQTSWLAPVVPNDLQLSPEGRLLFTAETWLFRGTKWVRFAIFDLERGERAFERKHGEGRVVGDPRLLPGPEGRVAFFASLEI